jgi:histidine triad (HIT) family protein
LEPSLLSELHVFSQKVALALEDAVPCQRVGQAVIGLEVPHAHVHLIPLNAVADINFERPKLKRTPEELAATAKQLQAAFAARWG